MAQLAIKVAVREYERGWGSKIDDHMVCLSFEDAKAFQKEFNSKNCKDIVPDWYMAADSEHFAIELNNLQAQKLQAEKRVWLSELKDLQ